MKKYLVFDMDGTIADLYGVIDWLDMLQQENPLPYIEAEPMYDTDILNKVLMNYKRQGWEIIITSWLAKDSTEEYDTAVKKAKLTWLEKYNFPYDECYIVKYGTAKSKCTKHLGGFQILIDDNEDVRKEWSLGSTIDANKNILNILTDYLYYNF